MHRSVVFALAALVLVPVVGAASFSVDIADFVFSPTPLSLDDGDSVTWTNQDGASHTVTCDEGSCDLDSPVLSTGETFTALVAGGGTLSYHCAIHPSMSGALFVGTRSALDPDLAPVAGSFAASRPPLLLALPDPTRATITVRVANLGGAPSPPVPAELRDEAGAVVGTAGVPALAPGEDATLSFEWARPPLVGSVTVTIVVDPGNDLVEGRETNDAASATVTVGLL